MPRLLSPARATHYPDRTTMAVPYDPQFLARFKAAVPPWCRIYDGGARRWTIYPPYCGRVVQLLRGYYPDAEILIGEE